MKSMVMPWGQKESWKDEMTSWKWNLWKIPASQSVFAKAGNKLIKWWYHQNSGFIYSPSCFACVLNNGLHIWCHCAVFSASVSLFAVFYGFMSRFHVFMERCECVCNCVNMISSVKLPWVNNPVINLQEAVSKKLVAEQIWTFLPPTDSEWYNFYRLQHTMKSYMRVNM